MLQLSGRPQMRFQFRLGRPAVVWICMWLSVFGSNYGQAADIRQILKDGRVPALSYAVIREGKIVEAEAIGVRDASTGISVDVNTVFEAASLSKPVFAYAVLQLVDAGVLSLDMPLSKFVADYVKDDPRGASITVRDVLSQTSGLPNWRSKETPLKTYFQPGARFSYSGEGFVWLQRVVEATTGEPLNAVMSRLVFEPLNMKQSSYVWRADFEANFARPHDAQPAPTNKRRPTRPNAASSLHATATDYARFLQAVLSGARLKSETAKLWLEPQVNVGWRCIQCIAADAPESDQHIAWGLGWGLEPDQGSFFHWGDNEQFKAFVVGTPATGSAVIVFTNGYNGMAIMPQVVGQLMSGDNPALTWLNYTRNVAANAWLDWLRKGWASWAR
jgi:CubicO group peptidase (beta-lactamase class C family)